MEQWTLSLCIIHRLQAFSCLTKLWTSDQTKRSRFCSVSVAELAAGQLSPCSQIIWVLFMSHVIWIKENKTIHINPLISSYAVVSHLSTVAHLFLSVSWWCTIV